MAQYLLLMFIIAVNGFYFLDKRIFNSEITGLAVACWEFTMRVSSSRLKADFDLNIKNKNSQPPGII